MDEETVAAVAPIDELVAAVSSSVDAANVRAAQANQIATVVIDGAIESERARRVEELSERVETCLNQMSNLSESILSTCREMLRSELEAMEAQQSLAVADALAAFALTQAQASTLPTLTETPASIVEPEVLGETPVDPEPPAPAPRPAKRHLFL